MTLTPPEVLDRLHAHGVTAFITKTGRLRIEPVSHLPAALVDAVKADPSGLADEIRRGWTPEGEGWTRVPPDRLPAGLPDDEWWERVLSDDREATVEDRRRLLVFRQVAPLPTARNLAKRNDACRNLYRDEIERWHDDERRLRADGFEGCLGGRDYKCPLEAPVRCQACTDSSSN